MNAIKNKILFINPIPSYVDILAREGYEVVPFYGTDRRTIKKVWSEHPGIIIYLIGNMDFNGIDPIETIPSQYRERTIIISEAVDEETLLKELNRRCY